MTVAVDAGLRIQGYASLWGVADLNGDVVSKGAFADSLKWTGAGGVRMLHQHESRAVVGVWDAVVEDERGLFVRGRIADWSAEARYAQALSRAGALDGLSIGFRAAKARRDGPLRVLSGVELWEVSLVTVPSIYNISPCMTPVAYAYSRYSTPAQAAGDSLRRQLAAAEAFATSNGLTLDTTLHDPGVSAFTGAHRATGALGSFLRRIESGEIARGSYLLVDSFDRLTRETVVEAVHLLTGIALKGVRVVTLNDGRVYDETADMLGLMFALMQFARGHEESAEKGRKVAAAHAENRRRAREEGRPFTPNGPHWLKLVGSEWQVLPERVAVVERVFSMRESGLGNAFIAKTFNQEGVLTPTGRGKWFNSTVADIAASRAVLGEYQPFTGHRRGKPRQPDGPPITDYYPPIIQPGQFYRVQAMNAARQNSSARPASKAFPNLLVGLVRCRECGGTAGYLRSTFPKAPNWRSAGVIRCNQHYRGVCSNRARIPYDDLEADLLPFIASLPLADRAALSDDARNLASAEAARSEVANKIEALLDQMEAGARVADRLRQRETELVELDRRIGDLRTKIAAPATPAADAQAELLRLETAMREASGDELYRIRARINDTLRTLLRGGAEMDGDQIVLRFHPDDVSGKIPILIKAAAGRRVRFELSSGAIVQRKGRLDPNKG